jgi:hypothetical protein
MDLEQARYIVHYYESFMSAQELRVCKHLFITSKITGGRSDSAAQEEATKKTSALHDLLSTDPDVKRLAAAGMDAFVLKTAERIRGDHREDIFFNNCPRCGGLARTPKARQCRHCFHDWHVTAI